MAQLQDIRVSGFEFRRAGARRTILKLTNRLSGTNLSTLQGGNARVTQVGGPKQTKAVRRADAVYGVWGSGFRAQLEEIWVLEFLSLLDTLQYQYLHVCRYSCIHPEEVPIRCAGAV